MSDHYQAIYDAVRSRLSGGNVGEVISRVAREAFDISHMRALLQQDFCIAAAEMQRPSAIYRPVLFVDGNQWCALYGNNVQEGVAGFGASPSDAMLAFDEAWREAIPTATPATTEGDCFQGRAAVEKAKHEKA